MGRVNFSRHFLLSIAALGLQLGIASADEPATDRPAALPPAETAKEAPLAPTGPALAFPQAPCGACTGECCDTCCCPGGRSGLVGGVGLYLIQPYFESNLAYGIQATSRTPQNTVARSNRRVDIGQQMEIAPLIWLGYISESGLGGRARWWYFRQNSQQVEAASLSTDSPTFIGASAAPLGLQVFANPSQALAVSSKLEVQVFDVEAMQNLQACRWDFLIAGGLRFGHIGQSYDALAFIPGRALIDSVTSSTSFTGVGPTIALEARRPLSDTALSLFASTRGSLLFGSSEQNAVLASQNSSGRDHHNRALLIGELEVGVEYSRTVGESRFFGQVALVGQNWFGAGSASRSSINTVPGGNFVGVGYVEDSDIGFLGIALRMGMNY